LPKAFWRWLIEPVELFDFLNPRGIHTLTTTVTSTRSSSALTASVSPLQLRDHLLDWTTWHKLDNYERQHQDTQQRGHHQQQAFQNIDGHINSPLLFQQTGLHGF
jgi:hypothetical protein